ncbi:hypothetical protein [Endozoicomonas sp. 8E]|uniref:hypothetical protein n=1 Tax=Endozoicomonas sp. 8E TaxID=3035692 RepID=UPI002939225B|nr:hypothetical protein [Endozoicomonas sp. 8E]WOG26964.1 hypothetical protein P6910_20800 [Endozoicomonas sp. 8E]
MSVVCQADPLARRFTVEFGQDADFPNHSFSIKRNLSILPDNSPVMADTKGYSEPDLPSDNKRHKHDRHGVKTTDIKSISWQWLYASNLLIAYEVILITRTLSVR